MRVRGSPALFMFLIFALCAATMALNPTPMCQAATQSSPAVMTVALPADNAGGGSVDVVAYDVALPSSDSFTEPGQAENVMSSKTAAAEDTYSMGVSYVTIGNGLGASVNWPVNIEAAPLTVAVAISGTLSST